LAERDGDGNQRHYDTMGLIVVDEKGDISAGTSSNGARNKIPGWELKKIRPLLGTKQH
jgi:isoaspartyl peptidase/L-asparaginase-like protein (Ntn-hydrolase superfamily)